MTALLVSLALALTTTAAADTRGQSSDKTGIEGAWTLNRELSDAPPSMSGRGDTREGQQRGYGAHGGRGMGHGGGMGGGMGGHGMGGGGTSMDPEQAARMREALHDIVVPPDSLTIVQTESMVVLTSPDGRTTRFPRMERRSLTRTRSSSARRNGREANWSVKSAAHVPARLPRRSLQTRIRVSCA